LAVLLLRLEDLQGLVRKRRQRALIQPATVSPVVLVVALEPPALIPLEVRLRRSLRRIRILPIPLEQHLLLQHRLSPLGRLPTWSRLVGSETHRIRICSPVRRCPTALIRPCISIPTVTTWGEMITIRIVVVSNKLRRPTFRLGHQRPRIQVLGVLRRRRFVDRARRRFVDRAL
jgi:hypothetical protein